MIRILYMWEFRPSRMWP